MCPRTKQQNDEIRERRKQQILKAAALVLLQKGTNLDIRDVAKQAQLGYGTVYHYYPNKHMLIYDLLELGFGQAEQSARLLQEHAPPLERLEAFLRFLPKLWSEQLSAFLVYKLASERFSILEPELRNTSLDCFQRQLYLPFAGVVQQAIAEAQLPRHLDPHKTANTLLGAMIGTFIIYAGPSHSDYDGRFVSRLLIKGIMEEQR